MFDRILLPLDGSELAAGIVPLLEPLLRRAGAEIVVFGAAAEFARDVPQVMQQQEQSAAAYCERIAQKLAGLELRACPLVRVGSAARLIPAVAEEIGCSLVALTSHGLSGMARWIFGSVTEKVMALCSRPVLVLPAFDRAAGGRPFAAQPWQPRRLLVPIDGSDLSLGIVPYATALARLFGAELRVLHVIHPYLADAQAGDAVGMFGAAGLAATPLLREGDPALAIVETCAEQECDGVAMTTHGRSGIGRWALGSVAQKVVREVNRPILLVRVRRPADLPAGAAR